MKTIAHKTVPFFVPTFFICLVFPHISITSAKFFPENLLFVVVEMTSETLSICKIDVTVVTT